MKTCTTTLLFILFILNGLSAQEVTKEMAATVGRNFLYEKFNQYVQPTAYNQVTIREALHWEEGAQTLLYIFNMNPSGFVIVAGQQALNPVLGYSCEHSYRAGNQPPNVQYWTGQYAEQVKLARDRQLQPDDGIATRWERYLDPGFCFQDHAPSQTTVDPLLTSLWDQGWPYNYYCPETSTGGSGGHVWAGCVATAYAQLLYYWRYPLHGDGEHCYIPEDHPEYGEQCADFENTWYRWDEMVDDPGTVNLAIAEFLYQMGVALDMNYAPDGSGAMGYPDELEQYFTVSTDYDSLNRMYYSTTEWIHIIMNQLDRNLPIGYIGFNVDSTSGHMWVCDGYQDSTYFHMNWGWGGTSNGYYVLDNLQGFNYHNYIGINFYPDTVNYTYPNYATGSDTLRAMEGSLTDGSGPVSDYLNNMHVTWLIDPQTDEDSVSFICV